MKPQNGLMGVLALSTLAALAASAEPEHKHHAKAVIEYDSKQFLGKGMTLAQLTSGLTVIVQENHAAPVATVRCFVKNTGSAYEAEYLGTGVSHMLEHLVAGGSTSKRNEKEIQQLMDSLGGRTNAYTTNELTAYHIDCPAKKVGLAIDLVAESMQFATIPENEYIREMGVVQRELEMGEADRQRVLYRAMKLLVYTEHPIRHPTIGYLPVVQSVKRQEVINFYKHRYVPQNLTFVVVGDVKTQDVLDRVLANFKEFQRTTERGPVLPVEPDQASPRSTQIEMEGETIHYAIGWPTVPLQHPDLYPLDVASYLLTTGDSSRLTRKLKIEQPLAIKVGSSSYTPGFVKGWFEVEVECKPENLEACKQGILQEIGRLKKEAPTEQELAKVKRQKAAEHVFSQQTVQAQADAIGRSYLSSGDPLFDDHYVKGIQTVTPEQVQNVIRKYFRPERENAVTIVPVGNGTQKVTGDTTESAESAVLRKKLPNGLTVLIKRHAVLPMVTVQAFAKAGILADTPETTGLAALTTELMTRGTEKYTGRQIAEYFDSIGGTIDVQSQRNTSYLTCAVLKEEFTTAFDYCYQVLAKPTFPADEFKKVQQLQIGKISARKANAQAEIMDFWATQLPKANPFSRTILGTEQTVSKLSVVDCRKFHHTYIVPENLVLAVYGDIDPQATLKLIEGTFGTLPKTEGFRFPTFPDHTPAKAPVTAHLKNQRENTAMVMLSFPTFTVHDEKNRSTLEVLNTVLTGGSGSGGRLFEELRGEKLVYYVFGMQVMGLAPGYFTFLAQTRPETASEVIQRIQTNLERVKKEGLSADDLAKAKEKLINGHIQSNTTAASQAFQACLDELYGFGFDYDKGYEDRINRVTSEDVKSFANKYLQNPLVVTTSPDAK